MDSAVTDGDPEQEVAAQAPGLDTPEGFLPALEARRGALTDDARAEAVAKQHGRGKLTARERLEILLDAGSFAEIGALVEPSRHTAHTANLVAPADGVVTGTGRIEGRTVVVVAFDFMSLGGSNGEVGEKKVLRCAHLAGEYGHPFVMLLDGGGHRIQEGLDAAHFSVGHPIFQAFAELSGWVPIVAAIMGPGFAGPSSFASMADLVLMVKGTSTMGIAGPALVRAGTGQVATTDELGSVEVQVRAHGVADLDAEDDADCLLQIRRFLSYLPSNAADAPPHVPTGDPPDRMSPELTSAVPWNNRRPYDVKPIVDAVADAESIFEIKPDYARNVVTAIARIDGRSVGLLANQPNHLGGTLDAAACEKMAHFISFCDAFGLPLIYFIDVPGFLIGTHAESTGLARRSGKLLFELGHATVPRFSVVLRKAYGLGYVAMCGGRSFDPDLCVAWPTAQFSAMSIEGAVDVAYRKDVEAANDSTARRAELIAEFRSRIHALRGAEAFGIDDVIDPPLTRSALAAALARSPVRRRSTMHPGKRHGITPV
jgi:acetyl-CoA carboxylase carboxyltransferase component